MKFRLLAYCFFAVSFFSFSQKEIVSQNGAWLMYFGNHRLSEKWGIHTEYQFRRSDFLKNWQQSLTRIGVDYHLGGQNTVTAGYGWIVSFPYGEQPIAVTTTEHRIWQQFATKSSAGRFNLDHRYRLEQRFIENAFLNDVEEKEVDGFKFLQRTRYRFMISMPLNRKTMEDNTLFLALYDEMFIGFGKGTGKNILEQNRLFGSIGWRFNTQSNVQLGYMNQLLIKSDGIKMERNHNFQLAWTYNFDFRN